jgi:hypothetical protein
MIKLSILYPNKPGSRFDIDYYIGTHMPLAMWGPAAAELQADIPRYTDVAPIIQFNEVKLSV